MLAASRQENTFVPLTVPWQLSCWQWVKHRCAVVYTMSGLNLTYVGPALWHYWDLPCLWGQHWSLTSISIYPTFYMNDCSAFVFRVRSSTKAFLFVLPLLCLLLCIPTCVYASLVKIRLMINCNLQERSLSRMLITQ